MRCEKCEVVLDWEDCITEIKSITAGATIKSYQFVRCPVCLDVLLAEYEEMPNEDFAGS